MPDLVLLLIAIQKLKNNRKESKLEKMSLPFFRRSMEDGEIGTVKFTDLDEKERCRIHL